MPSSTKIPDTIIIPNKDNTLMVISRFVAKINIPKKAIGIPAATQKAKRIFKNKAKKNKTNIMPIVPLFSNNKVRCFKVTELSLEISK